MANLKIGSAGEEVKKLQTALGFTGSDVDGVFGNKTHQAVINYQKNNNLAVDGIVGTNTWAALNKAQNTATSTPTATAPAATEQAQTQNKAPTFEYTKSDTVAQAEALLQQQLAQKPGEWQGGTWYNTLQDTINQIMNREKFSYDLNGDALYQQYKDQYTTQGKLAMMDTMGQAAAMTGGYGNSYAQTAGQQAYQGYLQQLNDKVPELYQLALDQYNREEDALYNQASLMAGMEEQEYGRYRDTVSDYYSELNRLTEDARYMSETEYNQALQDFNIKYSSYRDSVADDQWNQSFDYQKDRDLVADQQWQATFDEGVRQFDLSHNESVRQFDATHSLNTAKSGLVSDGNGGYTANGDANITDGISKNVLNKAANYTNNTDLANYLDGLVDSGVITEQQADALYAENKQADQAALNKRSWTLVDDGGINWFGGVDNNATVKDQYGNTYRLDKLVDALVAEGMTKKDAKTYVKNLQAQVGA